MYVLSCMYYTCTCVSIGFGGSLFFCVQLYVYTYDFMLLLQSFVHSLVINNYFSYICYVTNIMCVHIISYNNNHFIIRCGDKANNNNITPFVTLYPANMLTIVHEENHRKPSLNQLLQICNSFNNIFMIHAFLLATAIGYDAT